MIPSLTVGVAFTLWAAGDHLGWAVRDPVPLLEQLTPRQLELKAFERRVASPEFLQLKLTRHTIVCNEAFIAYCEAEIKLLAVIHRDHPDRAAPRIAAKFREIEKLRGPLPYLREVEHELASWEQQRREDPNWTPDREARERLARATQRLEQFERETRDPPDIDPPPDAE